MTVIAIGLDSAEPSVLEKWIAEGALPTFAALKEKGCYGTLENFNMFTAELPWTTFATGVMPEETGYWTPLKYSPDYQIRTRAAYEYDEYPAFFSLGPDFDVCSFDVPQVRLQKNLKGWQFNAWGAHSPQVYQESNVPEIYAEILEKYGEHPGLHKDYAHALNMDAVARVYKMLIEGARKRGSICEDLLKRKKWDLFLTVFGEPHGGGHNFWHFQPEHPLYSAKIPGREKLPENPLKDVYQEIDSAVAKILRSAPEDATVIVFSAHGMGPNTMDLPSTLFIAEFMYRYHYGRPALGRVNADPAETQPCTKMAWGTWERDVWNTVEQGSVWAKLAREYLPTKAYNAVAPYVEYRNADFPLSPTEAKALFGDRPWYQPTLWYSPLWPKMTAFALPSFSEGYIRLNVQGREKSGVVHPNEYHAVVDDICNNLRELRCARTGIPMVAEIVQTRTNPLDENPRLSDADIVVSWQEAFATDTVEHPRYGQIGPVPHFRAGSHRHTGFILAQGPGIAAGSSVTNGHALDIAPTILSLLGAPIPQYIRGKSCFSDYSVNRLANG